MILEKEEHFNRQTTDTKHTPTLFGELHEPRAGLPHTIPVVAPSYIRSEKRHVESVMIVAKQAQKADFLNG